MAPSPLRCEHDPVIQLPSEKTAILFSGMLERISTSNAILNSMQFSSSQTCFSQLVYHARRFLWPNLQSENPSSSHLALEGSWAIETRWMLLWCISIFGVLPTRCRVSPDFGVRVIASNSRSGAGERPVNFPSLVSHTTLSLGIGFPSTDERGLSRGVYVTVYGTLHSTTV